MSFAKRVVAQASTLRMDRFHRGMQSTARKMVKTLAGSSLKGASTGESEQKEGPQAPGRCIIQAQQPR